MPGKKRGAGHKAAMLARKAKQRAAHEGDAAKFAKYVANLQLKYDALGCQLPRHVHGLIERERAQHAVAEVACCEARGAALGVDGLGIVLRP